jgi:hypothetical protein
MRVSESNRDKGKGYDAGLSCEGVSVLEVTVARRRPLASCAVMVVPTGASSGERRMLPARREVIETGG